MRQSACAAVVGLFVAVASLALAAGREQAAGAERPPPASYRFEDGSVVLFVPGGANPEYRSGDRLVAMTRAPGSAVTFVSGLRETVTFLDGARVVRVVQRHGRVRLGQRVELYRREEVRFRNGEVTLAGTLLLPRGRGPHPAVVFASGAGRTTREELWWAADDFARRGIATLIYDKRGAGESTGGYGGIVRDYGALAGDLLAAVRLLKRRPEIDWRWVGVRGASEGGWVAPLAASRSTDVAFVIAVAAPGDPARQGLWSIHNHLRYAGLPRDAHQFSARVATLLAGVARILPILPPCCRDASFPAPVWEKVSQPVLLVYGGLDKEVPPALSARTITDALRRGGNRHYTVRLFPRANHAMFLATKGGFAAELHGWRTARLPARYTQTLINWVKALVDGASPADPGWRPGRLEPVTDIANAAWHESAPLQAALWALFVGIFLATLGGRLLSRLGSWWRKRPRTAVAGAVRGAQLLALATSAVGLTLLAGMIVAFAQFAAGDPSWTTWRALRALAVVAALLALALLIWTSCAWRNPSWARRARVRQGIVTATAAAFVPFLAYWHLLG